jgi:AraC-like DNA-binding protein/mannose-6-phosphate isomerase-like protein (cupin superfamily)
MLHSTDPKDYRRVSQPVTAMSKNYPSGAEVARHQHERAQLLYAVEGVMRVATAVGTWIVPPQRALWIPPEVEHELRMIGAVAVRILYIVPDAAPGLPTTCTILSVSPLLRELILAAIEGPVEYAANSRGEAIVTLVLHEIAAIETVAPQLTMPHDDRVARVCQVVLDRIGENLGLDDLAAGIGVSARTMTRLFQQETGMSFQAWRQRARLSEALARLATGQRTARVAADLGYGSSAAFITMFKRMLGTTPGRYFRTSGREYRQTG